MSLVVGVTGGIGSGKSAATAHFETLGIKVVDADLAARVIMEPGRPALNAVSERYGSDILLADGQLDRAKLRQKIFSEPSERQWLENLTHPLIGEEIFNQLNESKSAYTILSSPLLFETSQKGLCDTTLLVDVPVETQVSRTMARDANEEDQVRRIIAAQMSREDKLAAADHVVDNSGTIEELKQAVEHYHALFLEESGK